MSPAPTTLLLALGLGCAPQPTPLPTAAAVAAVEAQPQPPSLARALYDAPVLPAATASEQRVRLLLWLRRMALSRGQLDRLDALRSLALAQAERVRQAEASVTARSAAEAEAVYGQLFEALAAGADADDPALTPLVERLSALGGGGERERTLLGLRMEGARLVLDAERELLETLSPTQEERLAEALFLLRRRLDPVGTPQDWEALVGSTYDAGAPGLLLRGSSAGAREPLNLGGLWSDPPAGRAEDRLFPEARREALLFLAVLEPGLDEAIAAARPLAAP